MYPVSESYKTAIAKDVQDVKITGTITLKDSTVINITDEDIVLGSLYFSEQCVAGEDIEIGNVYASELGLSLTSPPENPYSLDGARIIVNFGIDVSEDGSGVYEYVPLGYFYVTEIERKQAAVNLKALDGMILFDTDLSGVLTTGTPFAIISSCCTKAGVTLATGSSDFADFANGISVFTLPAESKVETCRDLIMWVCQITGTFARMNRMGQLEVVPITSGASVKIITKPERFSSDVSDYGVKITQVTMKVGETEYSQGSAGMTLTLEENPLLVGKSGAEINAALAAILAQVTEVEYAPYNLTCAGDPALQAGDWVKLTGVSNINGPEFEYSRDSVAYHPDTGAEIPEDTPVFVDFAAGGKKGSLVEEGTTNLNSDPFFKTGVSVWNKQTWTALEWLSGEYNPFSKQNGVMRLCDNDGSTGYCSKTFNSLSNTTYTVKVLLKILKGDINKITCGGTVFYTDATYTDYTWSTSHTTRVQKPEFGENVYELTAIITPTQGKTISRYELRIAHADANVETELFVYAVQLEAKPYPTSFTDGTRAAPLKQITLPQALPDTFGIGISTKMLHAHDTATRTFWQAGDYRCYFDAADNKIKITNGVVEAETAAVTWAADAYLGVYAGRENGNLFIQAKIAGVVGTKAGQAGDAVDSGTALFVASKSDGTESVNATLADFVLHDRPEDIDPEGYLSAIPGGGGE